MMSENDNDRLNRVLKRIGDAQSIWADLDHDVDRHTIIPLIEEGLLVKESEDGDAAACKVSLSDVGKVLYFDILRSRYNSENSANTI